MMVQVLLCQVHIFITMPIDNTKLMNSTFFLFFLLFFRTSVIWKSCIKQIHFEGYIVTNNSYLQLTRGKKIMVLHYRILKTHFEIFQIYAFFNLTQFEVWNNSLYHNLWIITVSVTLCMPFYFQFQQRIAKILTLCSFLS